MIGLIYNVSFLAKGQGHSTPFPNKNCCPYKTVGDYSYTLVKYEDDYGTLPNHCKDSCVYYRDGNPHQKYCFTSGTLKAQCIPGRYIQKITAEHCTMGRQQP